MTNRYVWIGIAVGLFFAGLGIGYVVFTNAYVSNSMMMQNPQAVNQIMQNNPQFMNQWMNYMTLNPQARNEWTSVMVNNPPFMNQWMSTIMQNSQFQQQYMGPWIMVQNPSLMQGMMKQLSVPPSQTGEYTHLIVKTDQVSIVNGAWQINTTESYSPTIIQIITGTTVTWTNNDSIVHTVTDLNGTFDSHLILPNTIWKHDFFKEGKYNYFCTLHPWMKGLVIVTE
jgi:plastocyanin